MVQPARLGVTITAALLSAMLLAGCTERGEGPQGAPPEVSHAVVIDSLDAFVTALGDARGGNLRAFILHAEDVPVDDRLDNAQPGSASGHLSAEMAWGANGVTRTEGRIVSPDRTHESTVWCTDDYVFYEWEDKVYQQRAAHAEEERSPCTPLARQELGFSAGIFTEEFVAALPEGEVRTDGQRIVADFALDGGATYRVELDRGGRVVAFEHGSIERTLTGVAIYGPRGHIPVPEATERLAAHIETIRIDDGAGPVVYEVTVSQQMPRLEDMELHWVEQPPGGNPVVLAAFPLDGGEQAMAGAIFAYDDIDQDGRVSVGDTYSFAQPSVADLDGGVRRVILYDEWADREVGAASALAVGWLLVALGAVVVAGRRPG